jgi:MoCo/4Fe-4S cofactor protein with predicted Tat translocation signal
MSSMNTRKDLSAAVGGLWNKLDGARGKKYWRTLEELAQSDAFQEMMQQEFPEQARALPNALSRRQFLTLMGASLALAGLSGCSIRPAPSVSLVPYVKAPEEIVPGRPLFYATAMTLGGSGVGLLVETHQGRPTKIEGNPEHPASLGATDLFHQASILTLYDPDRSQTVTHLGETRTWDDALSALRAALDKQHDKKGAGVRILSESVVSPTLIQQLHDFLAAFPKAKWHQYEPLARDAAHEAAILAFGKPVNTYYDLSHADVIVSFDADFLTCGPGNLRYVADFTNRRRVRTAVADASKARMNRLYVVETMLSTTGAKADHRLAVKPSEIEALVWALAEELKVPDVAAGARVDETARRWIKAVADDLRSLDAEPGATNREARPPGSTLVVAGDRQNSTVHLLVQAINRHLDNFGRTVLHTPPLVAQPAAPSSASGGAGAENTAVGCIESLHQLMKDMDAGAVELLLILNGNPVYTAPDDFRFRESMQKVPLRAHLSLFQDETSRQCHWHLPEAHYLEAWSDVRSYEGTVSIAQPLIEPLYQGRSAHELLAALSPVSESSESGLTWRELPGLEIVKSYWSSKKPAENFETFWQETVHDGVMKGTAFAHEKFAWSAEAKKRLAAGPSLSDAGQNSYELVIQADPTIYDGRFANNGWLQELPKPVTTLTWDNAALMSPATAKALGVDWGSYAHGGEHGGYHQPVVELQRGDRKVPAPVWVVPGHAEGSITVHLGYGRERAGRVGGQGGGKIGFNAYALRTSDNPWWAPDLTVHATRQTYLVACTQQHQMMENREVVRAGTLGDYKEKPLFASDKERQAEAEETRRARTPLTLYEPHPYVGHKWGMVIDLTACTGCKACVVACQAENNIPVVGKTEVAAGREMHWLRVDRYIAGPFEQPTEFHFQPVPCMHCENAPCEYVCPVEATVHSAEGLNDMVYQRCVGTRFCSNNCPYKVRRFNFFAYSDFQSESARQQYNPDVTVRSRGVMEKCSYCVQRIRHAEIDSQVEGRAIFDGEILTACQSACPAQAILFGDMNDPKSQVKQWKESPLHYALLADLGVAPRTTYLAALRNPNPILEGN